MIGTRTRFESRPFQPSLPIELELRIKRAISRLDGLLRDAGQGREAVEQHTETVLRILRGEE